MSVNQSSSGGVASAEHLPREKDRKMNDQMFSMVQGCTDSYTVESNADGTAFTTIKVPARFRKLWMARFSDLKTDENEIRYWSEESPDTP